GQVPAAPQISAVCERARMSAPVLVSVPTPKRGCRRRDKCADQHRCGGEDRQVSTGLAGGVRDLASFRLGGLRLRNHVVDPLLGIGLGKTGASRYELSKICLVA